LDVYDELISEKLFSPAAPKVLIYAKAQAAKAMFESGTLTRKVFNILTQHYCLFSKGRHYKIVIIEAAKTGATFIIQKRFLLFENTVHCL
jgi:hypothetical protein